MSWFEGLKEVLSADKNATGKNKAKGKHQISELEGRLILFGVALILLIVAGFLLFVKSATSSSGISSCKSIILAKQKYECYATLATKSLNASICSFVGTQSGYLSCISYIAEATLNVTTCGRINSTYPQYDLCVQNVSYSKDQVSDCLMLKGQNESSCAYLLAQKNGFSSLNDCNQISNLSSRGICDDIYYYNIATVTRTPSYCALLPNVTNSTLLSTIVSKGYTNQSAASVDYFSYSALNITPKQFCYYKLAQSLGNLSYCSYSGPTLGTFCAYSVHNNQSNSTISANSIFNTANITALCSQQTGPLQGICAFGIYSALAVSGKNASACLQISNTSYQYSCIGELANRYNQSSYCNYIYNSIAAKQACVESVGITLNGSS